MWRSSAAYSSGSHVGAKGGERAHFSSDWQPSWMILSSGMPRLLPLLFCLGMGHDLMQCLQCTVPAPNAEVAQACTPRLAGCRRSVIPDGAPGREQLVNLHVKG